jgi:hypothetical protein
MKRIICSMVGLCVLAGAAGVQAQSLADVARKESARRKTIKRPTKVYTNEDVVVMQPSTAASGEVTKETAGDGTPVTSTDPTEGGREGSAPASPSAAPSSGAQPAPAAAPASSVKPGVAAGDEAKWRGRMDSAKEQLSRAQIQLEAMRTRVAQLQSARAVGPDGQQSSSLQNRQKESLQEFDKLRADVDRYQKAITDLEAEARAAGVPPGWLR